MRALASAYGAPDDDAPDAAGQTGARAASRLCGLYTALVYLPALGPPPMTRGASAHRPRRRWMRARAAGVDDFLIGATLVVLGNGCFKPK